MDWSKVLKKAGLALATFLVASLAAHQDLLVGLLPENVANMTVGGAVAAVIVAIANWLKHRND